MDHLLSCECGRQHRVSRSQAGQELPCECGRQIKVPTLRGLADLPVADQKGSEIATASAWKGWRAPALAVCNGLLAIALLFSAYSFLQSFRNQLNYSTEDFIAEGNIAIDEFGPDELSITWADFQKLGLKRRTAPMFHVYNIYSKEQKTKGLIGLGAAAVFGLIAAGIWWSAGNKR